MNRSLVYRLFFNINQKTASARSLHKEPSSDFDYDSTLQARHRHIGTAGTHFYSEPMFIKRALNQFVYDHDDKEYLDLFGGIATVSVGHCHEKVQSAHLSQSSQLGHMSSQYMTEPMQRYAERLLATLPDELDTVYFVNSGTEADELAIMLARLHTRRFDMIALRHGFHGMSSTAHNSWKLAVPAGFGIHTLPCPDTYRGINKSCRERDCLMKSDQSCECSFTECRLADQAVDELEATLEFDIAPSALAGFIVEPIQGAAGVIQYPNGYLKRAFELIRESGGVCIADEVQTGFGRLGDCFWGFESHDVRPDIVVMAKGMANGYPMGAVVTTKAISDSLDKSCYFNTFGGGPVACAVADAVLSVIQEGEMQKNCRIRGLQFMEGLESIKDRSNIVGDVRGKGLMIGVELIEDKVEFYLNFNFFQKSHTPLNPSRSNVIHEAIRDAGILVGLGGVHSNVLRLLPPMCITQEDVDEALGVFRDVLC